METLDSVRLSVRTRNQLSTLKRRTGIQNWNVLCRWAFCVSLAEPSTPRPPEKGEVGVELAWHTFGGEDSEIYIALAKQRGQMEGQELERASLNRLVRSHIERGVGYLVSQAQSITDLVQLPT
jgi:DNA sulfur modification protein DndE